MRWTETTPSTFPITADDVAGILAMETSELPPMPYVLGAIGAAVSYAETAMGRSLIRRTVTATFYANLSPADLLYLPRGPIASVTSVTPDGGAALATSAYRLEYVGNAVARLRVNGLLTYPKDLTVVYEAGHAIAAGSTPGANVPADIRHAITMHAAQLIQYREPIVVGAAVAKVPNSLDDFYAQRSWETGVG